MGSKAKQKKGKAKPVASSGAEVVQELITPPKKSKSKAKRARKPAGKALSKPARVLAAVKATRPSGLDGRLDKVITVLRRRKSALAEELGCARPNAYRRIRQLQKRDGGKVWEKRAETRQEGYRGPLPMLYGYR